MNWGSIRGYGYRTTDDMFQRCYKKDWSTGWWLTEMGKTAEGKRLQALLDERSPMIAATPFYIRDWCAPRPDIRHQESLWDGTRYRLYRCDKLPSVEAIVNSTKFLHEFLSDRRLPQPELPSAWMDPDDTARWLDRTNYGDTRKEQLQDTTVDPDTVCEFESCDNSGRTSRFHWGGVSVFMKSEFYTDFKMPRGIYARADGAKVAFGKWIKAVEDILYSLPEFIKHVPVPDRPLYISNLFKIGDTAIETDYSSWEGHFNAMASFSELVTSIHMLTGRKVDWGIFEKAIVQLEYMEVMNKRIVAARILQGEMSPTPVPPEIAELALKKLIVPEYFPSDCFNVGQDSHQRAQCDNGDKLDNTCWIADQMWAVMAPNVLRSKNIKAKCWFRRMSGDMWTSAYNGMSNLRNWIYILRRSGVSRETIALRTCCVVEGDDLLAPIWFNVNHIAYDELGCLVKLEEHNTWSEASFCGMRFAETSQQIITDPFRALGTFGWVGTRYSESKDTIKLGLQKSKAISYLYAYPGCPMVAALAAKTLELLGDIDVVIDQDLDTYKKDLLQAALRSKAGYCSPTDETRALFAQQYNITAEQQIAFEDEIFALTTLPNGLDVELPAIPSSIPYRVYASEYVHHVRSGAESGI